jgi:hypothetical protein
MEKKETKKAVLKRDRSVTNVPRMKKAKAHPKKHVVDNLLLLARQPWGLRAKEFDCLIIAIAPAPAQPEKKTFGSKKHTKRKQ